MTKYRYAHHAYTTADLLARFTPPPGWHVTVAAPQHKDR